jgi:hypothetical protein
MISLFLVTDIAHDFRFEYLKRTVDSVRTMLKGPITEWIMHEDSGDPQKRSLLRNLYPEFEHIGDGPRRGYGGSIIACWERLRHSTTQYIWHQEDDFIFPKSIDLTMMMMLLADQAHLAQLALRRQPWGTEPHPGGFMQAAPAWYQQREANGFRWIETTRNYTSNPNMARRQLIDVGWPSEEYSEGVFGFKLREKTGLPWGVAPQDVRFGFYGEPDNCLHIGTVRAGSGY